MPLKKPKTNKKLPSLTVSLGKKGKCAFTLFAVSLLAGTVTMSASATAAGGDPLVVVSNLSDFIFSLIRAVGLILLGWGVVQVGLSFQSHDPSQRSQSFAVACPSSSKTVLYSGNSFIESLSLIFSPSHLKNSLYSPSIPK